MIVGVYTMVFTVMNSGKYVNYVGEIYFSFAICESGGAHLLGKGTV